jgi:hypothetical protein
MYFLYQPEARFAALVQAYVQQRRVILPQPCHRKAFMLDMSRQFRQRRANARVRAAQTGRLRRVFSRRELAVGDRRGKYGCFFLTHLWRLRWRTQIQTHRGSVLHFQILCRRGAWRGG